MDKEMKKLLLVAVSVGVFLLVTITTAIIVLTPKTQPQENTYSSSIPYSHRNGRTQPEIMPPVPAVISNNKEPIVAIAEEIPEPAEITDRNNGDNYIIGVRQPTAAAVPDTRTPSAGASSQRPAIDPAQTVTQVRQPASAAQQTQNTSRTQTANNTAASSSRNTTASSSRQTTAPRPAPSRAINDFWVQTGAFSSMVRAEDAKELLSAKGLTSIIDSRIINGQHFYRVRLGPYTTQNEADHWLNIVKVIDGFQSSQVRQTVRGQ